MFVHLISVLIRQRVRIHHVHLEESAMDRERVWYAHQQLNVMIIYHAQGMYVLITIVCISRKCLTIVYPVET
jgi:hypothetical protein